MYQEHPEFQALDDDKLLWRYLDLPRYIDLLIKKSIFFCRADRFEDPFEGRFNKLTEEEFLALQGKSGAGAPSQLTLEQFLQQHVNRRMCTTISCWHQNNDENYAMWQIYAKGNFGMAIQTDFRSLKESFRSTEASVYIGKVNYFDESSDALAFDSPFAAFLNKRNIYNYENEVRCCYVVSDQPAQPFAWEQMKEPNGVFIPIDLEVLIKRIYISPNSPKWFRDVVLDIHARYGIDKEVIQSKVFESLDYNY